MAGQVNSTGVISMACTQALAPYLRVKYDATYGLELAGAEERELGTVNQRHIVSGLGASGYAPVLVANAMGTCKMVAAGAITQYATVYGAASGQIDDTVNENPIGIALEAATASGDYIEVLRQPNMASGAMTSELENHFFPLGQMVVWDAPGTVVVAATAANDDLAIVANTFGTSAPTIEGGDLKTAGATSRKVGFWFQVPSNYIDGETFKVVVNAGMKTTAADTSCTLDLELVRIAAPDTDICATAAQDMNSLTAADLTFTLTATNIVSGELLYGVITVACNDGAGGTAVIPQINSVNVQCDCALTA
jgi:hypothetical protein